MFFAFGHSTLAQVQFTALDNPVAGQTATYTRTSPNGFAPGSGGANVTWDFGALPSGTSADRRVVSRQQLPAAMQTAFPAASFGIVDDTTTYLCAPTGRTIRVIGIVTPRTVTHLAEPNNPYETRPTEFTQNQTHNDQYSGTVFYPASQGTATATARTVFDGIGTLILNVNGSPFRNVKRLVTRISRSDQFTDSLAHLVQQTISVIYEWYPERGSLPLMEYRVDTVRLFSNGRLVAPPAPSARLLVTDGNLVTSADDDDQSVSPRITAVRAGDELPSPLLGFAVEYINVHGSIVHTSDGSATCVPTLTPGLYVARPTHSVHNQHLLLVAP